MYTMHRFAGILNYLLYFVVSVATWLPQEQLLVFVVVYHECHVFYVKHPQVLLLILCLMTVFFVCVLMNLWLIIFHFFHSTKHALSLLCSDRIQLNAVLSILPF